MNRISSSAMVPQPDRGAVERRSVGLLLPAVARSRVTSVSAPAGFGKTQAIRFWVAALRAQGRPVTWIDGRSGFAEVDPFLAAARRALAGPPEDGEAPVLVVEDTDFLPEEAMALLSRFIADAPDGMTVILSRRGHPRMPLARLRSQGQLVEVATAQLRLAPDEAAALIAATASVPVDRARRDQLYALLGGWPAGMAMAARAQSVGPAGSTDDDGRGRLTRHLKEYLEQEVLADLPGETVDFLTDLSILPAFGRDEAMAVTGRPDSGRLIGEIVELGLFVEPVEAAPGHHRFYPFFNRLLYDRLRDRDADRAMRLHRDAATHYLRAGRAGRALRQADAGGDPLFLAQTLDATAEQLCYDGKITSVEALAAKLPWEILSRHSGIMLCLAWRHIRALAFDAAEGLLAAVESDMERLRADPGHDSGRLSRLQLLLRHRRALLLAARDDMPAVERISEELLAAFGDENVYASCTMLAQLMAARRELFHFHDTLKLEAQTRKALGRPGSRFASIALKASVASTLALQGKTATAGAMLEEALALAEDYQGADSPLAALPALHLAELRYETGDLAAARDLIDRHLSVARELGYTDQLCAGYLIRAKLLAADDMHSSALAALDEARLVALECGLDRLQAFVVAQQVQLLLRAGQADAASRVFCSAGFDPDCEPIPTLTPTRAQEAAAIAWIRIGMRQHRLGQAGRIARRWRELVRRSGAAWSVVQLDLILAEIATLAGEPAEARRHVRDAVTAAAEPGWTRIFVDEGEMIGALLREAYADGAPVDTATDRFGGALLGHFGSGTPVADTEDGFDGGLGGRLAPRENEILILVAAGLRNREIGSRLGLTEGTVKWYMQQIYDKLAVRRRSQAVSRARTLGLLG